ncbi:MAG: hypothetical protein AAFR92_04235 [Pseudomonadota bacterium]
MFRKIGIASLLLALTVIVSNCSASHYSSDIDSIYRSVSGDCPSEISKPRERVIWFCDDVTADSVNKLLGELDQTDILVIDSIGGKTTEAIRLAEAIHKLKITVLVNKICLSACAQHIALSANEVYFQKNSIFGMHDSQTATNVIVGGSIDDVSIREENIERAFYQKMGIDEQTLFSPLNNLKASCIINRKEYISTGEMLLKSKYDYYMPSKTELTSFAPHTTFHSYPNLEDVARSTRSMKIRKVLSINFGVRNTGELTELPDC